MTKYNFQLGFSRDDTTETFIENAGHIRARVLSATPTSEHGTNRRIRFYS